MKRILVINPNTSASVTEAVLAHCRAAHPRFSWIGATAPFGAPYIASEATYAVAAHAVLAAYAEHVDGAVPDTAWARADKARQPAPRELSRNGAPDAVLVACFGDPGVLALREQTGAPVLGLAEASFRSASELGPFAVVTGGRAWEPMLRRFARMHALDARLTGIHTVELTGAQIAAAPETAMQSLLDACRRATAGGAARIVIGGAALAGMAKALQPHVEAPLLDNVGLGAQAAVDACDMMARSSRSPLS